MYDSGNIWIGRNKEGTASEGNYIYIFSDGEFRVGEYYVNANESI